MEVLPNPNNMFQSLRYLQDQAAQGAFAGHNPAYQVMLYFTMNMWTKEPNNDSAGLGDVMYGRASIESVCAHTVLGRSTVKRAMRWLEAEGWIMTERGYAESGREDKRYITVLLNSRAHKSRALRRGLDAELRELTGEGSAADHTGGFRADHS